MAGDSNGTPVAPKRWIWVEAARVATVDRGVPQGLAAFWASEPLGGDDDCHRPSNDKGATAALGSRPISTIAAPQGSSPSWGATFVATGGAWRLSPVFTIWFAIAAAAPCSATSAAKDWRVQRRGGCEQQTEVTDSAPAAQT